MSEIITAIYNRQAKCYGKPIYQKNIEQAIQGVKDALNGKTTAGDYLMPAQREHPELYRLDLLGYWNGEREKILLNPETSEETHTEADEPVIITVPARTIIEFSDVELIDKEQKMTPEQLHNLCKNVLDDYLTRLTDATTKLNEKIKDVENEFSKLDKIYLDGGRRNNRRNWKLF